MQLEQYPVWYCIPCDRRVAHYVWWRNNAKYYECQRCGRIWKRPEYGKPVVVVPGCVETIGE